MVEYCCERQRSALSAREAITIYGWGQMCHRQQEQIPPVCNIKLATTVGGEALLYKPIAFDGEAATTPPLCYILSHFPRSRKEEPILTWEDRRRLDGWYCHIPQPWRKQIAINYGAASQQKLVWKS